MRYENTLVKAGIIFAAILMLVMFSFWAAKETPTLEKPSQIKKQRFFELPEDEVKVTSQVVGEQISLAFDFLEKTLAVKTNVSAYFQDCSDEKTISSYELNRKTVTSPVIALFNDLPDDIQDILVPAGTTPLTGKFFTGRAFYDVIKDQSELTSLSKDWVKDFIKNNMSIATVLKKCADNETCQNNGNTAECVPANITTTVTPAATTLLDTARSFLGLPPRDPFAGIGRAPISPPADNREQEQTPGEGEGETPGGEPELTPVGETPGEVVTTTPATGSQTTPTPQPIITPTPTTPTPSPQPEPTPGVETVPEGGEEETTTPSPGPTPAPLPLPTPTPPAPIQVTAPTPITEENILVSFSEVNNRIILTLSTSDKTVDIDTEVSASQEFCSGSKTLSKKEVKPTGFRNVEVTYNSIPSDLKPALDQSAGLVSSTPSSQSWVNNLVAQNIQFTTTTIQTCSRVCKEVSVCPSTKRVVSSGVTGSFIREVINRIIAGNN